MKTLRVLNEFICWGGLLALLLMLGVPAHAASSVKPVSKHAIVKTVKAIASPVTHPVKAASVVRTSLKDTVGGVLFALEEGVDSAHFVLDGLTQITTAQEDYFGVIAKGLGAADYVAGEADTALEAGEQFFFGKKN